MIKTEKICMFTNKNHQTWWGWALLVNTFPWWLLLSDILHVGGMFIPILKLCVVNTRLGNTSDLERKKNRRAVSNKGYCSKLWSEHIYRINSHLQDTWRIDQQEPALAGATTAHITNYITCEKFSGSSWLLLPSLHIHPPLAWPQKYYCPWYSQCLTQTLSNNFTQRQRKPFSNCGS